MPTSLRLVVTHESLRDLLAPHLILELDTATGDWACSVCGPTNDQAMHLAAVLVDAEVTRGSVAGVTEIDAQEIAELRAAVVQRQLMYSWPAPALVFHADHDQLQVRLDPREHETQGPLYARDRELALALLGVARERLEGQR